MLDLSTIGLTLVIYDIWCWCTPLYVLCLLFLQQGYIYYLAEHMYIFLLSLPIYVDIFIFQNTRNEKDKYECYEWITDNIDERPLCRKTSLQSERSFRYLFNKVDSVLYLSGFPSHCTGTFIDRIYNICSRVLLFFKINYFHENCFELKCFSFNKLR